MKTLSGWKRWTLRHILATYTVTFFVWSGFVWRGQQQVSASTVQDSQIHKFHNLRDEELLSSLNQYELVYSSYLEDGDFTRQGEENPNQETSAKEITLEGKTVHFNLDVQLNSYLTRAGVFLRHYTDDGDFVEKNQRPRCHYQGVVRGVASSTVSLSTCNGISGSLSTSGGHFIIKPLSGTYNQTRQPHVLYKVNTEKDIPGARWMQDDLQDIFSRDEFLSEAMASNHHRRVRREAGSEVKYLELGLFCSASMINRSGGSISALNEALDIVNRADMFYRPLNVRLVVTYVELWEGTERITISNNLHITLENFYNYTKNINEDYDAATFLLGTGEAHANSLSYYGTSRQSTICTEKAVSLSQNFDPAITPAILAHVLAHNLYIYNDDFYKRDGRMCTCGGSESGCLMYQQPNNWSPSPPTEFSQCSIEAFEDHLARGFYSCLFDAPKTPENVTCETDCGSCGNGILEGSETCDCGTPEECGDNPCCDPMTCQLTSDSECYAGECCSNCRFLSETTLCRESFGDCDVAETCSGTSGFCPDNVYVQDGTPCQENTGYCYKGRCPNRDEQCIDIWGAGSIFSEGCVPLNTIGEYPFGHCGYTIGTDLTYMRCNTNVEARCGLLHCKDTPGFTFFPYGLSPRGNMFNDHCLSLWVSNLNQTDVIDPSNVADGTKCGEGNVCRNFQCVPVETYGLPSCPTDPDGTVCSGNGVCTNENQCHCQPGWTGVACSENGVGNSTVFPPPPPSIPPPYPTGTPQPTPNATLPPPPPSIPPPYPTGTPQPTPNATLPPPPPSIPPPYPTGTPQPTPNATFPPPPPSIPPPHPTGTPQPTPNATLPPPPPSIPPPYPTGTLQPTPNATFPPPPPSIPPPYPTGTPQPTPNATFPPPPPSIPPPHPTGTPQPTPNATLPPPPPSIPPPYPTGTPQPTPNATFPPPPPSIPPPHPTGTPQPTPNATLPPPPPSIPPPYPTGTPQPTPNATFPPPPPSIPPPHPTGTPQPTPNATLPPPPPSIPPPYPTGTPQPTPNATFPPPPPSIPPPYPTGTPQPTPNATLPPPPPSIPPPYPTGTPQPTLNATLPPPPPSITPPYPTGTPQPTPNATFPPPPPSIPPLYPTGTPQPTPNTTLPPPPPSITPPYPTGTPQPTPNATFPPPPPSIPPPYPTDTPQPTPNTTLPPPPPSITPPYPTGTPQPKPNATFPPPTPSIPPPFPTSGNVSSPTSPNQQPTTQQPVTQQPSTQQPMTQQPSTQQPMTQQPSTQQPMTQQPATPQPSTQQPMTQQPSTPQPSTQQPMTQQPSTPRPSTQQPMTQQPSTPRPSTQQPMTQQPSTPQPSTQQPMTQQPSTPRPSTQQPMTQQPSTPRPSTQQPMTQQPSTPRPSTQQPMTQQPSTPQPSTPQPQSTQSPGYIQANLKLTILDSQGNSLYGASVRLSVAGGESKTLPVPELTNVIDISTSIPENGSLGVVVSKKDYTSNAIRWQSGVAEVFEVRLIQLKQATVGILGDDVLIETDVNAYGQTAMFQFDPALINGTDINAGYVMTSDLSLIPVPEAAEGDQSNTVALRPLGALELTISDADTGVVVPVKGNVDMMVPLEQGLNVKDGMEIGIWTYNETTAFWEESGTGAIVITQDLLVYWSFTAPHLSWWMAAERVEQATTKPPVKTVDPGKPPSSGELTRTQLVVYVMIAGLLILPLLIVFVCLCCCKRRGKSDEKEMTRGSVPVAPSEMEVEMQPRTYSNKGLQVSSNDLALEINENEVMDAPKEMSSFTTQAEIQFQP